MSYQANKKWRKKYPLKWLETKRRSQKKRQQWINQKKDVPCFDCKINYPSYVMQFDHRDPKLKIGELYNGRSISWMEREIKKCDIVCANCHMERTHDKK